MRVFLAFLLAGSALLAQPCVPAGVLTPAGALQDTLGDANCRLSSGTAYAEYSLNLPVRGHLDLKAASGDFDLVLILRDSRGHLIDSAPEISRPVESGAYRVIVSAAQPDQAGNFTLSSAFTPEPNLLCSEFPSLGLNQQLEAQLTSSSCHLPDGTAYDGYLLNTFGAGTLDITMASSALNPYVILRDDSGHPLASDTGHISLAVNGGQTLTLIAAAADTGTGAYHLAVRFTSADSETCRSLKTFTGSDQHQSSISQQSCVVVLDNLGDTGHFNYYDLTVPQAGSGELRVTTQAFDPGLVLLDGAGNVLAADYESGGAGQSAIRLQLKPGAYTVQVVSAGPYGGDYALQYTFLPGPAENCPVLDIQAGNLATGTISPATCRTSEGPGDVYRLTTPSAGTLHIDLGSSDFDTELVLRDAHDNRLVADAVGGGPDSQVVADLPAGTYVLVAAAAAGGGGYGLLYQFTPHDLAPCTAPQAINPPGFIGQLGSAASCAGANGQPVDWYQFATGADGTVAAVMTSQNLDSFLTLTDGDGNTLAWDDNSFGGTDSLLIRYLPAGTYRIAARAAENSLSGLYRLDLRVAPGDRPAGCSPLQTVSAGSAINGQLSYISCPYPDSTFADIYQFNVTDQAQADIRLNSSDFDAYLLLLDAKGNVVGEDDDSGGGTNARLTAALTAGTYYIVAKPVGDYTAAGAYTLSIN